MLWCCIEPERVAKSSPIMEALAAGFGGKTCLGEPPDDGEMFVVWGQIWTTLKAIPKAVAQGRPFLQVDNGYVLPGRGGLTGYYRITYNSLSPIFWQDAPPARLRQHIAPWRTAGRHVLLALPGEGFGRALGLDMTAWIKQSQGALRPFTQRQIIVRPKSMTSLSDALQNCWALVTHSSNVAVDAVLSGIPVFVAETSPAAPVGNLDWRNIEMPEMPERKPWYNSLIAQQFTVAEMRSGLARDYVGAVIEASKQWQFSSVTASTATPPQTI